MMILSDFQVMDKSWASEEATSDQAAVARSVWRQRTLDARAQEGLLWQNGFGRSLKSVWANH